MTTNGKLTAKQTRFVEEYTVDFNGAAAAIRAGYSPRTAKVIAAQNLTKLNVATAIRRRQRETMDRLEVTREMVINGLYREATNEDEGTSQSARVQAWMGLARVSGYIVDKREVRGHVSHEHKAIRELSTEDLKLLVRQARQAEARQQVIEGETPKELPPGEPDA